MRHIIIEFQKVALAHPSIRFSLHHNDSEVYNLMTGNYRQRIIGVFGKQINQELITLETSTTLVSIKGFIGKPESARRTYGEQFFFVNDRFMKHPYFHKAVSEAYQNILPPDTIPSYFIYLETDPGSIDINIHPTKTEIKFEDERAIWQILMASVREALGRFNIAPSLDFDNEVLIDIPVRTSSAALPEQPVIEVDPLFNPFDKDEPLFRKTDSIERFERENIANWEKLYATLEKENENPELPGKYGETERKFFQIKGKYIVCPVKSGLMLIDQKRAHERVLFEKFMECLSTHKPVSQAELFPVVLEIDRTNYNILREIEPDLKYLGFTIRFMGNNKISIKGRPVNATLSDPKEMLDILIEEYKNSRGDPSTGEKEKIAAAMAGASAVPYGKTLGHTEIEDLFDSLFACSAPNYSPKGKPVISIITIEDLDKKFR